MDTQRNPYIGPRTFQRNEGHLFFGREREARDLISLVASERLVVFYAQSGAGKSSIVNTRLIPNLEEKQYEVLPVGRVSGDSGEGIEVNNIYIYNLLRSLEQHDDDPAPLAGLTLAQFLCHLNYDDKGFFFDPTLPDSIPSGEEEIVIRRALIIDQFEELFSTHPEAWEKREDFFLQIARAMQDDPHLWVVLVMREDYIAALDPYAHLVSNGLRVRYYMQRLGREAALKAVKSPVEGIRPYADGVAEKLIDDLCSIKVQQPDGSLDVQPGQYVEPVQMQVVCYGLWDNLSPDGSQITEQDLQDVGDVNQSLGKYYDRRVAEVAKAKDVREQMIREWFEKKLITTGGIRNMVLQERDPKPGELSDDVIQALQSDLVRGEKRGGATWYELTHDRLVEPILERNKIWFSENLSPLQRQAALWKDQDQNESWLLRDQALVEVEEWAKEHYDELTETEREFLGACQKQQAQIDERQAAEQNRLEMTQKLADEQARAARRARVFNIVSGILIVVALIATVFSVRAARIANDEKIKAETAEEAAKLQSDIAHSGELSITALERSNSQLDLALLLGVQADNFDSNTQTQKALLALMQKSSRYLRTVPLEEKIDQIQFSSDGSTFASYDANGVTLWNAKTYARLNEKPIKKHFSGVTAMAFHENDDGAILASGAADGTIVIWNAVEKVALSKPFKAHSGSISSLVFSPDGRTLASGSWSTGEIVLWDISTPEKLAKPLQVGDPLDYEGISSIICLAFSPNGEILAAGDGNYSIVLWDVETHEPFGEDGKERLTGHDGSIYGVAFTPDGQTLASGSYDDDLILWDVSDPENPEQKGETLEGHPVDIETITISPDGRTLASGDDHGNIILWDLETGEAIGEKPLNGRTSWVISLAFSPDSNTLLAGSLDGQTILWDVRKQIQIGQPLITDQRRPIRGVAFSGDGKTFVTASEDSTILFWDASELSSPQKGSPLQGHPGQPRGIYYSADGSLLASQGDDGTILLDVETQEQVGIGDILRNRDGDVLVYQILDKATNQRIIHLMDNEGKPLADPIAGQNPFFSPDEKLLVYETIDPETSQTLINVWDIANKKNVGKDIEGLLGYPTFSADHRILIYQTSDPEDERILINLWSIEEGRTIAQDIPGSYLAISSDHKILIYQTTDPDTGQTLLHVRDIDTGLEIGDPLEGGYLGFNPSSQILVYQTTGVTSDEYMVILRDIVQAVSIETIQTNEFSVSPDGTLLAYRLSDTESGNMMLHVVDTSTGEPIMDPVAGGFFAWSGDGNILLFSTYDDEGANSTNALNTRTGRVIHETPGSNFQQADQLGDIFVYQTYNYGQGKYNIMLINSTTGTSLTPEHLLGSALGLAQSGLNFTGRGLSESDSSFDLSADGRYLIYGPDDGSGSKLNVWDITQNSQVASSLPGSFRGLYKNQDNEFLVYQSVDGDTNKIYLYDLIKRSSIGESFNGTFLGVSPDGKQLATLDENNSIVFWDTSRTWPLGDPILKSDTAVEATTATVSPDGKILAFAEEQGITLQDVATAKIINSLKNAHYGTVLSVYISHEKDFLLTFGDDAKAILWDLKTYQSIGKPMPITLGSSFGYFSANRNFAFVVDSSENTTTIWDLKNKRSFAEPLIGQTITLSPNETYLAVSDASRNTTVIWDMENQQPVGGTAAGQSVSFSSDEKYAAIRDSTGNTIILWELPTGKAIGTPFTGTAAVFSPKGNLLAVVNGNENTIMLWDLVNQTMIDAEFTGQHVSFASDDRILAITVYPPSSADVSTTQFLDLSNYQPIGKPFQGYIISSPNTTDILAVVDTTKNTLGFWDSQSQKSKGSAINITSWYFRGTQRVFLVIHDNVNGETTLWDPTTQIQIGKPLHGLYDLQFGPGEALGVLTDTTAGTIVFLDLKTGEQVGPEIKDVPNIYPVICADNTSAAWHNPNNAVVRLWDLEQGQSNRDIELDPQSVQYGVGLLFNSRCDALAVMDYSENETTLWDPKKGQEIGPDIDGTNVVFSSDGSVVAIGSYSGTVTFWNTADATQINTEELKGTYLISNPENSNIISVEHYTDNIGSRYVYWDLKSLAQIGNASTNSFPLFDPDGKLIIAGAEGVSLWDVDGESPALDHELQGHVSPIREMRLSQDGKLLASLASDGISITDVTTGASTPLANGDFTGQLSSSMAFSANGGSFTALGMDGTILTWNINNNSIRSEPTVVESPYTSAYRFTLSPDGNYLVYENNSNDLYIYDITNKETVGDPFKVGTCCSGGAMAFTPDANTMFFNDGGRIFRWDQWTTSNDPQAAFSFGQNQFSKIHALMGSDPENPGSIIPKYLVTTHYQTGNYITQIWDWDKNSRVGDPIPGNIEIFGSNWETRVLIYKDNEGRLIRFDLDPVKWKTLLCQRVGRNLTEAEWDQYIGLKELAYQKVCP